MRTSFLRFVTITAVFIGLSTAVQSQVKNYSDLEEQIEQFRVDWDVPGLSVAIVQNGEIVFNRGFGELEKGKGEQPDGQSLYAIASISKAFTSASLAMLVDEGKLKWDDKVVDYLPYFELYDPWVTQHMNIEDLLAHRSGLKTFSGDLLWHASTHSMEEVVKRAKFLEPEFEFRDGFGYQNIMFIAAGLVLEKVSGKSWAEFVQERILDPLEMNRTLTSSSKVGEYDNVAIPHSGQPGENIPIPYINWDNMAPAGALVSNAEDLCRWMTLQLNRGINGSDTLFTEDRWREMWTVHNPLPVGAWAERTYPGQTFDGYGLGWNVKTYRGEKIVSHGGGYDAMISNLTMIPGHNAGFVILTNNVSSLSHILHLTLLDFIIGGEDSDKDWSELFLPFIEGRYTQENERVAKLKEQRADPPNHKLPLKDYTGTYGGEMYGNLEVKLKSDTLKFQFVPTPLFSGWFEPMSDDTFILHWDQTHMLPVGTAQFLLDEKDKPKEVEIVVPNPDFYFEELEFKRLK